MDYIFEFYLFIILNFFFLSFILKLFFSLNIHKQQILKNSILIGKT